MDGDRFDSLARLVGAGASRRFVLAALAALAALSPTAPSRLDALAKKGKGKKKCKKCGPCKACKKGKCKPRPEGSQCNGGSCVGGVCRSGRCSVSQNDAVTVVTEQRFGGKPLRAEQTVQPIADGDLSSQLDLTLDGDDLLSIATEGAEGTVTVTVTYGQAFQGIRRARFTNNGSTITGEIDGRAIVPLPASANPSSATFADGNAPPEIQVDPELAAAIDALVRQAAGDADRCNAARRGHQPARQDGARGGKTRRGKGARANPQNSIACIALYIPCGYDATRCVSSAGSSCALALFGYAVCVVIAVAICAVKLEQCRRGVRHNAPCCPVRCGGDGENEIFGDDPGCCEEGEQCVDPNHDGGGCCPPGTTPCGGRNCCTAGETCSPDGSCCGVGSSLCGDVCCPSGSCLGGECCAPPNGVCGSQCCPPFSSCCGGECCSGSCVGGECCEAPRRQCGQICCGAICCNGRCCPAGQGCDPVSGLCVVRCGKGQRTCENLPGMPTCCLFDEECCQNGQCCPPGTECCFLQGVFHCSATGCVN